MAAHPSTRASRAFSALVAAGLAAEGVAGWLAYRWAAQVLPCRWAPARALFGPSTACPMPVALVGHSTLVPVVLCGGLVLTSVVLFARSFVAIALATWRAKRELTRQAIPYCLPPAAASVGLADGSKWLVVMGEEVRTAFCVGLLRPWVVVSAGLLERFGEPGLRAVLEHELSHRRRRDPLRWAVAKSLARGVFFMPSLTDLADVVPAEGEVSADATAARSVGRDALVGALQELLGHPIPAAAAPIAGEDLVMLRLKALETGERPRARLHLGRLAASALVLVALLGAGAWLPRNPALTSSCSSRTPLRRLRWAASVRG